MAFSLPHALFDLLFSHRNPVANAAIGKRGRASANDDEGGAIYEWKWGSRAQAEIGEAAVGRFVGEFMVERALKAAAAARQDDDDDDDEEEGEQRNNRRNRAGKKGRNGAGDDDPEKMLEAMMKGINRAAGGKLREAH